MKKVKQVTEYECDRCGNVEDTTVGDESRKCWGECEIQYRGYVGSRTWTGDAAGTTLMGKVWLCMQCTKHFQEFLDNER